MIELHTLPAKRCLTAAGMLIHEDKVLLIKHKKVGIWFCPGGHIDHHELPHCAAEREFFEETGIRVKAIDPHYTYESSLSQYVPSPIETNLHWVCEENYQMRQTHGDAYTPNPVWPKGCEQHVGFVYLMKPLGSLQYTQNTDETDGIAWFTMKDIPKLETNDDIRAQIAHGFELIRTTQEEIT